MSKLIPSYMLRGRWIVVLVCYLDDSGKDSQNPLTSIAGYIARDTEWELFEHDVEQWFDEYKVGTLHATHLKSTERDFKGWRVLKKQAFVARVCQARNSHVMMGLHGAVHKQNYSEWRASRGKRKTLSHYSFCFNLLLDRILRDIRTAPAALGEGIAFVLESGHENNNEAEQTFHEIRKLHHLEDVLHSISFVSKDKCRAIQLADLWAFYSRRESVAHLRAREAGNDTHEVDTMIKVLTENLPHWGYVVTDFGEAAGSRFAQGDP